MILFTSEQERGYILNRGLYCPFCGCSDISASYTDMPTTNPDELLPKVTCENHTCGKTWFEQYKLVGIYTNEEGDKS